MAGVIGVSIGAGLGAALLFNRPFVGRVLARGLLTLPWSFPDVPTVLVFVWILNPQFGVITSGSPGRKVQLALTYLF